MMQFQADMLGVNVERPVITETTALGAAYLAGIAVGLWSKEEVADKGILDRTFKPQMDAEKRERSYKGWKKAVRRTMDWARDEAE